MKTRGFEELQVYQLSERLADAIWDIVVQWENFAKFRVGGQLTDAADSIGANIAEGTGRGSYKDNKRFVRVARGSLCETRHWLRRAFKRKLLTEDQIALLQPIVAELAPRLNAYHNSIGPKPNGKGNDSRDEMTNDE